MEDGSNEATVASSALRIVPNAAKDPIPIPRPLP